MRKVQMKTRAKCREVKNKNNVQNKEQKLEMNLKFYPSLSVFRYYGQGRLSAGFKPPQLINIRS